MASILARPFDLLMVLFFSSHALATIFVDSQSIVPREYFPSWATSALDWHIKVNGDHLVKNNPPWFVALVWVELVAQLPFFFIATYAFWAQKRWIRIPALIYGVEAATSLVAILGDIVFGAHTGPHTPALAAIYAPYLVIPLLLVARMAAMEDPFPGAGARGRGSKGSKRA